jgi:PilZ domain-containing protein
VTQEFRDRRRSPRVVVNGQFEFRAGRRIRVRLIDISANGALLATDERVPVGATGRMHLLLGTGAFETKVEVKREEASGNGRGRLLGVSMFAAQAMHQAMLDDFLRRAGS